MNVKEMREIIDGCNDESAIAVELVKYSGDRVPLTLSKMVLGVYGDTVLHIYLSDQCQDEIDRRKELEDSVSSLVRKRWADEHAAQSEYAWYVCSEVMSALNGKECDDPVEAAEDIYDEVCRNMDKYIELDTKNKADAAKAVEVVE